MSTLEPKDEYKSLRDEILHRFQKIYDAEKYGIGSIVILIGYFLTTTISSFCSRWSFFSAFSSCTSS